MTMTLLASAWDKLENYNVHKFSNATKNNWIYLPVYWWIAIGLFIIHLD